MRAFLTIREAVWYRRQAFERGLRAAGYEVFLRRPDKARPGDVLCQWNRYGSNHHEATQFEREGGRVLACENGYIGKGGISPKFDVHPKGPKPDSYYAVGLGFHNDHTRVLPGEGRWQSLGLELKPWRADGGHILVCPNRSFGVPGRMMPVDWAERCVERLRKQTKRPVRVRGHPGNDAPPRPLIEDLRGAWAVYVWSSSCAVHSLLEGIPTFIEAPYQILKGASAAGLPDEPGCPERLPHFEGMACGQFQLREIESGAPFRLLATAGSAAAAV